MALEYDIELNELILEKNELRRENTITVESSLLKIQEILRDIEKRLGALE